MGRLRNQAGLEAQFAENALSLRGDVNLRKAPPLILTVGPGGGGTHRSATRGRHVGATLAVLTSQRRGRTGRPDAARLEHRRPQELAAAAAAEHAAGRQGAGGDRPAAPHPKGGGYEYGGAPGAGRRGSGWSGRRPPPSTGGPTRPSRGRGGVP